MKNRLKQSVLIAFLYIGIAMLSLNLTSCEEGGIDSQPATGLKVGVGAQSSYTVTALAPGDITFNITSNTPWTIHSNQDWCQVTPVSSTVSALVHDITVTTDVNMDNKPRTAVLTITGEGVADQTVTITQDAKLDFEVSMFEVDQMLERTGETRELMIVSNKPWTLSSDKAWLTFDKTSGEGGEEVNVIQATAEVNNGNLRRATITVKSDVEEKTYTVTQDGNLLEITNIEDTIFSGIEEVRIYHINSNLDWKVQMESPCDWLHINSTNEGTGRAELEIHIDYNYAFKERSGSIKLSPKTPIPGVENVIIPIRQPMGYTQVGEAGTITYNANGSVTFETTGGALRFCTVGYFKKGTFTWTFSAFDMGEEGCFNMHADGQASTLTGTNSNFIMWLGPTYHQMSNCGGDWGWQAASGFDVTGVDFSSVHEIKLEVLDDEANPGMLRFTLYVNGNRLWNQPNKIDPFTKESVKGVPYYWGFNRAGAASFTIDSFSFVPQQ